MGYRVAVVGATGNVGREMLNILSERLFPADEVVALASGRSNGREVSFGDGVLKVQDLAKYNFSNIDIALFSAGSEVAEEWAPKAAAAGAIVIDNSSFWRYDIDVPLIVPEVNPDDIGMALKKRIIANPNCSTAQLVVALKPLHDVAKIKRVIVGIAQLETIEPKTKNPALHGELDLNSEIIKINNSSKVTLVNDNNEEIAAILIGKDSKLGNETRYVRRPNNDQSWLVWRNFDVPLNEIDWLDDSLFSMSRGRVADIEITHPDGHVVFIKRDSYAEQYFKIQNLDENTLPINPYIGNQIGSALDNISLVNINLKSDVAFDNAVKIVYTTFDGLKLTINNQ